MDVLRRSAVAVVAAGAIVVGTGGATQSAGSTADNVYFDGASTVESCRGSEPAGTSWTSPEGPHRVQPRDVFLALGLLRMSSAHEPPTTGSTPSPTSRRQSSWRLRELLWGQILGTGSGSLRVSQDCTRKGNSRARK